MSEGRLELPAFAFVARCDDPISLLRRWGVLRELNSELQSHILPCCRYTKDAIENGGVYGIRTREIPDRQSGGVDHWPNTPKWRIGGVPTSRGGFRPPIRFPSEADCQFQHLSKMAELSGFGPPRDLATPTGGLANRCLTRLGLQLLGGRGEF